MTRQPAELSDVALGQSDEPLQHLFVQQLTREADDVLALRLGQDGGGELPTWAPGAHVDVVLPSGLVRQYSLCGDLGDRTSYRIGVLRELASRGGSHEIHESVSVGQELLVCGPRNHFRLTDDSSFVFIAGGIGIAPLLPMLAEAERRGTPWCLHYGGRSRSSMAFLDEIAARRGGNVDIVAECERGYLDLSGVLDNLAVGTAVFACGPPGMLAAIEERCAQLERPEILHLEHFSAPQDLSAIEPSGGDTAFEVELARQGTVLTVPADRTLLEVVREATPSILYSCEEGYCGSCETKVLGGIPEHRDSILTDGEREANETMMICVGRAKSPRLVLDI